MRKYLTLFSLVLLLVLPACGGGKPLELTVNSPADSATVKSTLATVVGLVNKAEAKVTYKVNGGEAKEVTVGDNGVFSFDAGLKTGSNTVDITATEGSTTVTKTLKLTSEPTVATGLNYDGSLNLTGNFTRPDDGNNLSDAERTSPYSVYTFNVETKNWYAIFSAQQFDGYLLLYKDSFDVTKPLQNLINENDDYQGGFDPEAEIPGKSRIRAELEPGQYVVITTAFSTPAEEDDLSFSNNISKTDPPPPPFQLPVPDDTKYNITVRFLTNNVTAEQQAVFVDAANRWASIITSDLSNIDFPEPVELTSDGAAVVGTIDDILIDASFTDIDGPSNVLGRAGPRFVRTTGENVPLTIYGSMEFDVAEFAPGGFFDDPKGYADVILHEMGHVLGIGTLWDFTGNLEGFDPDAPTDLPIGVPNPDYDPRFIGAAAKAEYLALLGANPGDAAAGVPIENTGGGGSINAHWRELTFDNELMSPSASGAELLSRLTAASLGDMGYGVNLESDAIEAYSLPLPPTFKQLTPTATTYVYLTDFLKISGGTGSATGTVQGVDLKIDEAADPADPASANPANSTSGCEPEDFTGFTAGNIALMQRGNCAFTDKVDNAEAAGAIGVIFFNQGNTPERKGLFSGASSGLPGVAVPYDLGVALAGTAGLTVEIANPVAPASLETAALKPAFQEEILLPVGSISANGKIKLLPNR